MRKSHSVAIVIMFEAEIVGIRQIRIQKLTANFS